MSLSRTSFTFLVVLLFAVLWMDQRRPSGSHSLRYSFSLLSEPLPGAPQYSVVGHVDDVVILSYTSESGRPEPRAPWMEKITDEDPRFWKHIEEEFQEAKKTLSESLRSQMEQKNQSPGLHVFQAMLGCELHEDGSVKRFERFAYDGSNYIANTDPTAGTEDTWDAEESVDCMKNVQTLLKCGEESLLRRVTPQTKVSQRKSGDHTFLIGYAYGFYPREIEANWVQDGVEIPWESREILPNPDGTYQVRTTVEVKEGDNLETYEYHVNHSSLPVTLIVTLEYDGRRPITQGDIDRFRDPHTTDNMSPDEQHAFQVAKDRWLHVRRVNKGYHLMSRRHLRDKKAGRWSSMPEMKKSTKASKDKSKPKRAGPISFEEALASADVKSVAPGRAEGKVAKGSSRPLSSATGAPVAVPSTTTTVPMAPATVQIPETPGTSQEIKPPTTMAEMSDAIMRLCREQRRNNKLCRDIRSELLYLNRQIHAIQQKLGLL